MTRSKSISRGTNLPIKRRPLSAKKLDGSYVLKTDRRGNLAHLYPAHAGGGCLPRHQESADGAADFSSSAEPHPVLSVGAFSTQPSCLDNKIIEQGTDGDPAIPSRERP